MSTCPRCQKAVYFAEQALGPNGVFYHKPCLACVSCNKRLDSTNCTDRNGEPFCKVCYGRQFGPKGVGYGVLNDTGIGMGQPTTNTASAGPDQGARPAAPAKANLGLGGGDACPNCSKQVYFAEQALAPNGLKYHKSCYKCGDCNKLLDSTTACEAKDQGLYCRACHGKKFGPKGYGFAGGAAFLHTQ